MEPCLRTAMPLSSEEMQEVQAHMKKVAAILHRNTPAEQLKSLEGIEQSIRQHVQTHVSPELAVFLLQKQQAQRKGAPDSCKVI